MPRYASNTMTTTRIINQAVANLQAGMDPIDAIEAACESISTGSGQREFARTIFMNAAAKAERG